MRKLSLDRAGQNLLCPFPRRGRRKLSLHFKASQKGLKSLMCVFLSLGPQRTKSNCGSGNLKSERDESVTSFGFRGWMKNCCCNGISLSSQTFSFKINKYYLCNLNIKTVERTQEKKKVTQVYIIMILPVLRLGFTSFVPIPLCSLLGA